MDASIVRLSSYLLLSLSTFLALLGCTVGLLHLELCALLAIVGALVMQFVVLSRNLFTSYFAVAAATSTKALLVNAIIILLLATSLVWSSSPQLNIDLTTLFLLAVRED